MPPHTPPLPRLTLAPAFLSCPITALAFLHPPDNHDVYLLAGEETRLRAYHVATRRTRGSLAIFTTSVIHGICVGLRHVLVWGGASVAVLPVSVVVDQLVNGCGDGDTWTGREVTAPDWIYDGLLKPDGTGGVLVTAHNELVEFAVVNAEDSAGTVRLGRVTSPSRPILYSANLRWLPGDDAVLVAGGTVFGEIIVWRCRTGQPAEVLAVLEGHEGSIFGVHLSDQLVLPTGETVWLLASCSDDRTVRIWNVVERRVVRHGDEGEARETGFGGPLKGEKTAAVAVAMGHVSRIWHVRFSTRGLEDGSLAVYSFGEDATTQEWRLSPGKRSLEHVKTTPCHGGKHIWATAMLGEVGRRPLIATGGSDGKIALLGGGDGGDHVDAAYSFADLAGMDGSGDDAVKTFAFAAPEELVVTSKLGRVFAGVFREEGGVVDWNEVDVSDAETTDLRSYSVVRSSKMGHRAAFLGSASGKVYMFTSTAAGGRRLAKVADLGRKVSDIFALPRRLGTGSCVDAEDELDVVVTLLGHDGFYLLSIPTTTSKDSTATIRSAPLARGSVITAANICNGRLVLGTRDGVLIFYQPSTNGQIHLIPHTPTNASTKDAITSIVPLPDIAPDTQSPYVLTTARDGKYLIHNVTLSSSSTPLTTTVIHESSPPFGPVITEARFDTNPDTGEHELVLCGFRSRYFVAWNETRQTELATVDCGGAHRTYAHSLSAAGLRLAYSKAKNTNIYTQRLGVAHAAPLRSGMHGREVRAASWCADNGGGLLLATAAEDTTVRIWRYEGEGRGSSSPRCVAAVSAHTAGLQALAWACGGRYLVSSGGNEELFVWRVARLDAQSGYGGGLAVVCEGRYPDRSADGDLRILSLDVMEERDDGQGFVLSIVLSNSVLRTYRYVRGSGFEKLADGRYTGVCLTQIRHLDGGLRVVTASTDGCVVVWEAEEADATDSAVRQYAIKGVHTLHQSSIKGLDLHSGQDGWLVLTTGDDNALGVLRLQAPTTSSTSSTWQANRAVVRSAHAAGITGVRIIGPQGPGGHIVAATISNDQRMKLWRVGQGEGGGSRVELLQDRYSTVADAGDLDVVGGFGDDGWKLVVAGVGVEVWDVKGLYV